MKGQDTVGFMHHLASPLWRALVSVHLDFIYTHMMFSLELAAAGNRVFGYCHALAEIFRGVCAYC